MAEAVGLAASLVSLASLFSTCIECFGYYRAAKDCPRQIMTKLVRLDFEKTRLLIWANHVGLVSTDARSRDPGLERHEENLRATLEQIKALLAEGNKMQDKYGVRQQDQGAMIQDVSADLVSRNSLETFKASFRRFRGKFSYSEPGPKFIARIRWAIADETKFETLIKTLRDFVDNLFWLVPVDRSVQDQIIEEDIMAVGNIMDLEIIKEASEYEYQAWSDAASRAVDRTERGTVPYTDVIDEEASSEEPRRIKWQPEPVSGEHVGELFLDDWGGHRPPTCFVLTDSCMSLSGPPSCQDKDFGRRILGSGFKTFCHHEIRRYQDQKNDESSPGVIHDSDPGPILGRQCSIGSWTRRDVQRYILNRAKGPFRNGFDLKAHVFLYVAPCERLIAEAVATASEMRTATGRFFYPLVRVDDRLCVSCCQPGKERDRLVSLSEQLSTDSTNICTMCMDQTWLDQRIHELEEENPLPNPSFDGVRNYRHCYQEENYSPFQVISAIMVLGEEAHVRELLASESFPRHPHVPVATEMYAIHHENPGSSATRKYLGKYHRNLKLVLREDAQPADGAKAAKRPLESPLGLLSPASMEPATKRQKLSREGSADDQESNRFESGSQASDVPALSVPAADNHLQ